MLFLTKVNIPYMRSYSVLRDIFDLAVPLLLTQCGPLLNSLCEDWKMDVTGANGGKSKPASAVDPLRSVHVAIMTDDTDLVSNGRYFLLAIFSSIM